MESFDVHSMEPPRYMYVSKQEENLFCGHKARHLLFHRVFLYLYKSFSQIHKQRQRVESIIVPIMDLNFQSNFMDT